MKIYLDSYFLLQNVSDHFGWQHASPIVVGGGLYNSRDQDIDII